LEVDDHLRWIAANPTLPRLRPVDYRRVNLKVFPYYIAYALRDDSAVVPPSPTPIVDRSIGSGGNTATRYETQNHLRWRGARRPRRRLRRRAATGAGAHREAAAAGPADPREANPRHPSRPGLHADG